MSKKDGPSMGDMKGGSMKRTDSGEYQATILFANGVEGIGVGKTKPEAQQAAVADARLKSMATILSSKGYVLHKAQP
jgi:hypothetical protein